MKKLIVIILSILFLIGIYGCKDNAETDKAKVLIGSGYMGDTGKAGEDIGILDEVWELSKGFSESLEKYEKKGDVKNINIFDTEIKSEFKFVDRYGYSRTMRIHYYAGKDSCSFDVETGRLMSFLFLESKDGERIFPEGYEVKSTPGTLEEVEKDAQEILKRYVDDKIDLNDYEREVNSEPEATREFFRICYKGYDHGIWVRSVSLSADKYGNIYLFKVEDYTDDGKVKVPKLEDKDYIDGAKKRLEEFYKDNENIVEVKDYKVNQKILAYLPALDTDAVAYSLSYTLVYKDGTERKTGNQFYYLFD